MHTNIFVRTNDCVVYVVVEQKKRRNKRYTHIQYFYMIRTILVYQFCFVLFRSWTTVLNFWKTMQIKIGCLWMRSHTEPGKMKMIRACNIKVCVCAERERETLFARHNMYSIGHLCSILKIPQIDNTTENGWFCVCAKKLIFLLELFRGQ